MKVYPSLKLRVCVDDITAFMKERNKECSKREGVGHATNVET